MGPRAVIAAGESLGGSGGLAQVAALQQGILREQGWQVDVVTPDDVRRPWRSRKFSTLNPALLSWQIGGLARRRTTGGALLCSHGMCGAPGSGPVSAPQQVHLYHGTSLGLARACRPRLSRLEFLITGRLYGMLEARAGRGSLPLAVSAGAAAEADRFYGIPSARIVHNGVDTDRFHPMRGARHRESGFWGVVVGRMDYGKGRETIRRLGELLPLEYGLRLAAPQVQGEVAWDGGRTEFLGAVPHAELPSIYGSADYLLCASRYEGFGLTLIEAWACGIPVVTTDVGIIPELRRLEPALDRMVVDDPDDVEGFAARIRSLREDPELARRQAEWGRSITDERFSLASMRRAYAELLAKKVGR